MLSNWLFLYNFFSLGTKLLNNLKKLTRDYSFLRGCICVITSYNLSGQTICLHWQINGKFSSMEISSVRLKTFRNWNYCVSIIVSSTHPEQTCLFHCINGSFYVTSQGYLTSRTWDINGLFELHKLSSSYKNLHAILSSDFSGFRYLKRIYLRNNKLYIIQVSFFLQRTALRQLWL